MNLKRGDILWPIDSAFISYASAISGILIITSIDEYFIHNMPYGYVYFYQLKNHKHDWHTFNWIKKHYKVLQ